MKERKKRAGEKELTRTVVKEVLSLKASIDSSLALKSKAKVPSKLPVKSSFSVFLADFNAANSK